MKRMALPLSAPNYSVDRVNGDVRIRPRAKLLERQPPASSFDSALATVHERLAVCTELFQHHGDGGRCGVHRAMAAVIDCLSSLGIPYATLRPIEAVMAAIVDADNGAANPIFDPKRRVSGGRPKKPVTQREFEGMLAMVMECSVRHCRQQGKRPYIAPAAQLAAKMINESSWPVRVTAKQLTEIRERIQQSPSDSPDRMQVDVCLSGEIPEAQPLAWAKLLLSHEWVNPPPNELSA